MPQKKKTVRTKEAQIISYQCNPKRTKASSGEMGRGMSKREKKKKKDIVSA